MMGPGFIDQPPVPPIDEQRRVMALQLAIQALGVQGSDDVAVTIANAKAIDAYLQQG